MANVQPGSERSFVGGWLGGRSPFIKLAPETVAEILVFACGPYFGPDHQFCKSVRHRSAFILNRVAFMGVCKTWMYVVIGCSELWTSCVLEPFQSYEEFTLWSGRTKDRPVDVWVVLRMRWNAADGNRAVDEVAVDDILEFLREAGPRTRSLGVYFNQNAHFTRFLTELQTISFPVLRRLCVVNDRAYIPPYLDTFSRAAILPVKAVETLRLSSFVLPWQPSQSYASLKSLVLSSLQSFGQPDAIALYGVFAAAQRLEIFSVDNVRCSGDCVGVRPLVCPQLKIVHLALEDEPIARLVALLRAPLLSELSVSIPSQLSMRLLLQCAEFMQHATTLTIQSHYDGMDQVKRLYASVPQVTVLDLSKSKGCFCAAISMRKPTWERLRTLRLRNPSFGNLRGLFGVGPMVLPRLGLLEILYTHNIQLTVGQEDWLRSNVVDMNLALAETTDWWVTTDY
ncbi:hypothetical protein K438DRAFT_1749353 [Mycena galopus ATCC 62051]|nr:hypothetical protein K438DRAFT_1749353 [Mycena galopus ATCC 62051]